MFIFSNLAISLDGKIATQKRQFFPLGTKEDYQNMQKLRMGCDALLMGATTFRTYKKPCFSLNSQSHPMNIILSSTLEGISPKWPFFQAKGLKRIFFVSSKAPSSRIKTIEKTSEVIVLKNPTSRTSMASQIISHLKKLGVRRLLIEGGGEVMWQFARENWIQEYHVTLTPKILGGALAPTLVDGTGFGPKEILNLKLRQCRIQKDEIYLIYQNTQNRG